MSRFEAISLDIEGSRDKLPLGLGVNSVTLSGVRSQFLRAFGSLFYAGQPGHFAIPAPQYCFADTAGTIPAVLGGTVARVNSPVAGQPHLVQVTAAARPILGRNPSGGIRNLIAQASTAQTSENFGAWALSPGAATREQVVGKGPFTQGWRVVDTSTTQNVSVSLSATPAITNGRHAIGVFFSYDYDNPPTNGISLFSMQGGTPSASAAVRITWNPDGTVASAISAAGTTEGVGIDDLGDGLYFAWARANYTVGAGVIFYIWPASFVSEGTSTGGIILYGATVEKTDTRPGPYQRVTSAFDITEATIPDAYYLQGDGVDDHMVTSATVDMSTLTKARLVAGLEKFTDVNAFYAVSHGADATSGNLSINKTAGNAQWTARSRGTGGLATSTVLAIAAPDRAVLTADVNRTTDFLQLRYNNAAQTASSVALGGSGLNATLAVLAQPDGTLPMNGRWYGHAYADMTDADLARVQQYFASRLGETLT